MVKRPTVDLMALTSDHATSLPEATQRATTPAPVKAASPTTKTANLKPLAFKVPPEFRRRYKQRAAVADLKLNELLFEALAAWEREKGL